MPHRKPRGPSNSSGWCRGDRGSSRVRHHHHLPLRLRPSSLPGCSRTAAYLDLTAIAGPNAERLVSTVPLTNKGFATRANSRSRRRDGGLQPALVPVETPAAGLPSARAVAGTADLLAGWTARRPVRGRASRSVERSLITLEAADLCPHRRHCRGAHHLAARTDRRTAQLGLSLLLDPRRDAQPLCPASSGYREEAQAGFTGVIF